MSPPRGVVRTAAQPALVHCVYRLLETVRDTGARRILTVFGAEGHGDPTLRPVMGEVLHYKVNSEYISISIVEYNTDT